MCIDSVGKAIRDVAASISRHLGHHIRLPIREESVANMHDFERRSGMPFVTGAVDESHIPIVVQREVYVAHYC